MRRGVSVLLLLVRLGALPLAAGLFGLLLAAAWLVIFMAFRVEVALQAARSRRLLFDLALLALCLLGGFEGGWYLVPAASGNRPTVRRSA